MGGTVRGRPPASRGVWGIPVDCRSLPGRGPVDRRWNRGAVNRCGRGAVERWGGGAVERCGRGRRGAVERCGRGAVERWGGGAVGVGRGAVERCGRGAVERWSGGRWSGGAVERWSGGAVERWSGVAVGGGAVGPWGRGAVERCGRGAVERWAVGPWSGGAVWPWGRGAVERCGRGAVERVAWAVDRGDGGWGRHRWDCAHGMDLGTVGAAGGVFGSTICGGTRILEPNTPPRGGWVPRSCGWVWVWCGLWGSWRDSVGISVKVSTIFWLRAVMAAGSDGCGRDGGEWSCVGCSGAYTRGQVIGCECLGECLGVRAWC